MPGPDDPQAAGGQPLQNFEPSRRHVGVGPDSDGDGLSDDFETNVFGSDPTAVDPDGDGLSDWAEYWVDTNPNDADTEDDGFLDGEDLAFGDPLAVDAGGAERTALRERARRQFDAEGSDKDKDWLRDHVEADEGTKSDKPDSDGDGLGDGVEAQMRRSGITTSQDSTPTTRPTSTRRGRSSASAAGTPNSSECSSRARRPPAPTNRRAATAR